MEPGAARARGPACRLLPHPLFPACAAPGGNSAFAPPLCSAQRPPDSPCGGYMAAAFHGPPGPRHLLRASARREPSRPSRVSPLHPCARRWPGGPGQGLDGCDRHPVRGEGGCCPGRTEDKDGANGGGGRPWAERRETRGWVVRPWSRGNLCFGGGPFWTAGPGRPRQAAAVGAGGWQAGRWDGTLAPPLGDGALGQGPCSRRVSRWLVHACPGSRDHAVPASPGLATWIRGARSGLMATSWEAEDRAVLPAARSPKWTVL